jgi:VWFA-related protein
MHSRLRAALVPALVFIFTASSALDAQKAPKEAPAGQAVREEARVVVVEVPINVTDRDGHPVENLTAEDFEVFDDGKPQKVTGFEVLDQRKNVPLPLPGEPPINPAASRHFMLVFDLSFASSRGVLAARRSARDFVVTRMKDLDTAAVATYMVESGMRLVVPFTGDRTQLASAIDTLGLPSFQQRSPDALGFLAASNNPTQDLPLAVVGEGGNTADIAMGEALENMQVMQQKSLRMMYRDRVQRLLDSFAQVAVALNAVPGRKHILYFSEGFDSRELSGSTGPNAGAKEAEWAIHGQSWKIDNDSRYGNTDLRMLMQKALVLFNRSDCTIHSVDIGGLRTTVSVSQNDLPVNGQDSLYAFAEQTGGEFLKNANDLGPSLEQVLERTGLIYLLAFQPVRVPENGKFHVLKVKVKKGSYRVSHRTGYYEPKSNQQLTALEKKLAMSSAIAAAVPKTDIPAWVLAAAFPSDGLRSRVPVIVEIPGDRLLARPDKPVLNVDVFLYAVDRAGTTQDSLYQAIGIDLAKARETLRKGGIKFYGQLFLPPGDYTLRVLVRDGETGRFGVTVNALAVPGSTAPFALPPFFIDPSRQWIMVKARPRGADEEKAEYPFAIGGESFVPAALAGVKSGQETHVCLIAYNFDPSSAPLDYSGRVLGVDGKAHGKVSLELVKASEKGERGDARKLLLRFRPSGLDPGRYALAVRLLDAKTGKSSESSFPFDVE